MEELLKIAKEKYPVGTVFKSAFNPNRKGKVTHLNFFEQNGKIFTEEVPYNAEEGIGEAIYHEGLWAEIISIPEVKEETMTLLEEAKKRFPVGTKFVPAHIDTDKDDRYCIIVEDGEFVEDEERQSITQELKDGRNWDSKKDPKYGTTSWGRLVYNQGNWARIIEEPETRIVESFNECKAESPLIGRLIVEDPHSNATLVPGKARVVKVKDNINPSHYKGNGKVECIDALDSATVNKTGLEAVCTANVIKYLWRYEDKNGLEDVKKAQWYLEKLIKHLENGTSVS